MELIDKAKETATHLAEQAKDKLDGVKERRKVDGLLGQLGRVVYRQRTGRPGGVDPNDELEIERLVAELQSLDTGGGAEAGPPASGDAQEAPEAKFVPEAPPPADV